eukprot:1160695-Pelagomonas_calceolata.AAC.8
MHATIVTLHIHAAAQAYNNYMLHIPAAAQASSPDAMVRKEVPLVVAPGATPTERRERVVAPGTTPTEHSMHYISYACIANAIVLRTNSKWQAAPGMWWLACLVPHPKRSRKS